MKYRVHYSLEPADVIVEAGSPQEAKDKVRALVDRCEETPVRVEQILHVQEVEE